MRRILKPGRNCFEYSGVKEAGLYVDGAEYYTAFYQAALQAKKYILISGWQFDSEVLLLRGQAASFAPGETRFLRFLDELCARNSELRIYILAWDFSFIFMLEREWIQEFVFNWASSDRLQFRFDSRHPIGASQHQKYAVIDGSAAFLGGMDICAGRWDERSHTADNLDRINPDGGTYAPYHDIQGYFTGPLVETLSVMFKARWEKVTGAAIQLPPAVPRRVPQNIGLTIAGRMAALSRTHGQTFAAIAEPVKEIRALYTDAITAADKLVYIENQYFSSYAVFKALMERMEDGSRPKLNIVLILPKKPNALSEEISVGLLQTRIVNVLRETAGKLGHSFGVYYSAAFNALGEEVPVYIHSKLMIVDDRFITIGSANTTNRSMGLDSELNVSWEACPLREIRLSRSIKRLRVSLLMEHIGADRHIEAKRLSRIKGLVDYLDFIADRRLYKLQHHSISSYFEGNEILKTIDELVLDPEKAVIEENIFEIFSPDLSEFFSEGITFFKNRILRKKAG